LEGVENFEGLEIIDIYHKYYGRRLSIFEKSRDIFFKNTSILIDPIYNAVAITYLIEKKLNNVLYVNTGGSLNNLL
jgi:1-aminocyclopropane-1-carboxylate deaminase/D-cysteine desulfhydrase-like pyridoxal-dependent ACC family enzyme